MHCISVAVSTKFLSSLGLLSGMPDEWEIRCLILIFLKRGFLKSGKYLSRVSSRESFPSSASLRMLVAVNCLETEAMLKKVLPSIFVLLS